MVITTSFSIQTRGNTDIIDITSHVCEKIEGSGVSGGVVNISVAGSTAGITTIEYEPGVLQDLKDAFDRIAPKKISYAHDARWGDGNGFSHVRSALLGTSASFPFASGQPLLGTWQQIVLIDFDNRQRNREVIVQLVGE